MWCHIPQGSTIHSHDRKILKSNAVITKVAFLKYFKVLETGSSTENKI
jgi:hypothetical protein